MGLVGQRGVVEQLEAACSIEVFVHRHEARLDPGQRHRPHARIARDIGVEVSGQQDVRQHQFLERECALRAVRPVVQQLPQRIIVRPLAARIGPPVVRQRGHREHARQDAHRLHHGRQRHRGALADRNACARWAARHEAIPLRLRLHG
jgi:hypothetical protein